MRSAKCTLLKTIDAHQVSQRWLAELGISWLPPSSIKQLEYWRDEKSGLQFYSPREAAGDATLYSQLQHLPWYYMEEKWEFDAALRLLSALQVGSRVLEIGVGKGAFLSKAQGKGILISGMELNPDGAQSAREKGFRIVEKDMAALHAEDPSPWDAICAFQVLEHLPEPRLFLDQAISLLKPGGLLILSVPNAEVARKLDPERNDLLDQPPHHMSHWDEGVFRSMETFLPLKLRHVEFESLARYHISWFVGSWSQRLRKHAGQLSGKMILNRVTIPVLQKVLELGLRHLVRGHTLLVCFEKIERVTS
jgi:SAM-dependent methyltransferase